MKGRPEPQPSRGGRGALRLCHLSLKLLGRSRHPPPVSPQQPHGWRLLPSSLYVCLWNSPGRMTCPFTIYSFVQTSISVSMGSRGLFTGRVTPRCSRHLSCCPDRPRLAIGRALRSTLVCAFEVVHLFYFFTLSYVLTLQDATAHPESSPRSLRLELRGALDRFPSQPSLES